MMPKPTWPPPFTSKGPLRPLPGADSPASQALEKLINDLRRQGLTGENKP